MDMTPPYDPEESYRYFKEELRLNSIKAMEDHIGQLKRVIKDALLVVMQQYSEEVYCAGWLIDLDIVAPRRDSLIHNMAISIGEIPFWESGDGIEWRDYPGARDNYEK